MQLRTLRWVCLLACLAIALPVLAQRGADPLSGTWTGDWGPNANDRNNVSVDLKWDGKALTGTVHSTSPQRPDVMLTKTSFTAATGAVHMEAEVQSRGAAVHYIIDGKVANGSMTGSWNHGTTKGDFKLTKK